MKYSHRIGFWTAVTLVALRVLIGWHFFTAGVDKLEPNWTSAGFLRGANGPFADFYRNMAPLPHRWDELIDEPLPPVIKFSDERRYVGAEGLQQQPYRAAKGDKYADGQTAISDTVGHIPFPTAAHGPWASEVAKDWRAMVKRFQRIIKVTDEQRATADQLLDDKLVRLAQYMEANRPVLDDYHHELARLNEMRDSDARGELPYLDERILSKKAEVAAMPRPLVSDIAAEEDTLVDELVALLDDEQKSSSLVQEQLAKTIDPPTTLDKVDVAVTILTLGVGGCLIVGLFTRAAAVIGAGFLLSVMSTQPPWSDGVLETVKVLTGYQAIELCGLLVVAVVGAGAWAGLDGMLWRRAE